MKIRLPQIKYISVVLGVCIVLLTVSLFSEAKVKAVARKIKNDEKILAIAKAKAVAMGYELERHEFVIKDNKNY